MTRILVLTLSLYCCIGSVFSQESLVFNQPAEKLSTAINTHKYDELNPKVSADGKRLYFNRWKHPSNAGPSHDIWYSNLINGEWQPAVKMSEPLTISAYNTSVESVLPDGNTLALFGYYSYAFRKTSPGFSISKRDKKGWQFPKGQTIDKLKNKSTTYSYFLAPTGKTTVISVEAGGEGGHDLWVCFPDGENQWTKPLNMGEVINTRGDESTPFIAADNKTLFFASDGHKGMGIEDIYMSRRLDNTWTNWSKPINLGDKINNAEFNAYFSIDAAGEYAYFTSAGDIYRIPMPKEAKPDPLVLISGKVLNNKTKEPIGAEIQYFDLKTNKEIGYANSDPITGDYKIALPKGENYAYLAQSSQFYSVRENLDLSTLTEYKELKRDLYLAPIEKGEIIRLNNIFFETAKAQLLPESYAELDKLTETLENNSSLNIKISGHTDDIGSEEDNQKLSEQRAQSVYNYLIKKGIKKSRLSFSGYGENKTIANNSSEEGRQLNRRVEFEIL